MARNGRRAAGAHSHPWGARNSSAICALPNSFSTAPSRSVRLSGDGQGLRILWERRFGGCCELWSWCRIFARLRPGKARISLLAAIAPQRFDHGASAAAAHMVNELMVGEMRAAGGKRDEPWCLFPELL